MAKVPMAYAADVLAQLCDDVDKAEHIDEFLISAFNDAEMDLADAADRRIAFDRWVKIQVAATEEGYRYYRERKELLEKVHERFKAKTKEIIEAKPDLPYSGKLGKISLCDSPVTVDYAFGLREVTPGIAKLFGVPDDYVIEKTTYHIDSDRVKAELQRGEALEWASLKQGTHIRFPAQRKPKNLEGKTDE